MNPLDRTLPVQIGEDIHFWPYAAVATIVSEFRHRARVVHQDGTVAHIHSISPLGCPYANPDDLQPTDHGWLDPAGFCHQTLPPAPQPLPPLLPVADLPCPRQSIRWLLRETTGQCRWVTDQGDFLRPLPVAEARLLMPELVQLDPGKFLHARRLHHIEHTNTLFHLVLDSGEKHTISKPREPIMAPRFGLDNFLYLEPRIPHLYRTYLLRDWPFEIDRTLGPQLRQHFSSARLLIAHLIWQRFRYRQLGIDRPWPDSYRGFWYQSVAPALYRSQFLQPQHTTQELPDDSHFPARFPRGTPAHYYNLVFKIMDYLVEDARLIRLSEFGFTPPRPELRHIGKRHPHILLVVEKESCHQHGRRLADEFGLSLILLDGQPKNIVTEDFSLQLQQATPQPLQIIAYVDYDPDGWIIARATAKQLQFWGKPIDKVDFLIRGDAFTSEEKQLYAKPCHTSTPTHLTKAQKWFQESGGVDGQMLGIHADHVRPYARLKALLHNLIGEDTSP